MRNGKYREAERDSLRALRLLGAHRGEPTRNHLDSWNELGMVYKYLGKFQKARGCYRAAFRYGKTCLTGSDRYDFLANLYHNLGGLEHSQRRFRRAEPYARKSVEYRARVRPRNSLSLHADRVALAAILDGLGKFDESEEIYRGALKAYRRAYGASHREIALVLNNLAAVYQKTGRLVRAEKMYRDALAMKGKTVGRAHPDFAATMNNLAMLLEATGRTREAERYFEEAYRLLSRGLGLKHPNTRAVLENRKRLSRRGAN